ncbi:bifunctional glycosyltransferase family 2 protein/CDP-glycerol:glycerophosphate glycerophosphotransferase [Streptomyces sp. NBC_01283]|uniref:bifunctional glycosyltransferase/CDP-glycerol:glycerophosphate glycerophosphotransferase n=1 Tax=Streptomyces sp. NBC_01283 TaxID=2903812 RepID=UPI00352D17B9|nr:bifunctional glycosyltransferase family 2 protein/CDP-glycerol:glycerophosphate glycerophosphotransferase [Streptomyces sp. NBC_01283]
MSTPELHDVSCVVVAGPDTEALRESVRSVLDQTMGNVEAVVVDPGTDAPARAAARELAAEHPHRVRLVGADSELPVAAARNLGLDAARGRYVIVLGDGELLERHACRNLFDAARSSGADLVAGRWTRLTGNGKKERGPGWQAPLHARTRTVGDLADAPELVARDSLVTGFCVRRDLLHRTHLRYAEDLAHSEVLFGVEAALVVRAITLVPNLITTRRAAADPARETPALAAANDRVAGLLVSLGRLDLADRRERAFLVDHVLPCARTFPQLTAEERRRATARVAPRLEGRADLRALDALDPVERVCVRLLAEGDTDGVLAAAYALGRPGVVVSELTEREGKVYWRTDGLDDPQVRELLDVTELGHQHRQLDEVRLLNRLTRCDVDGGTAVLEGHVVLPGGLLPDRPPLTAWLDVRAHGTGRRGFRVPVEEVHYDGGAVLWRATAVLTARLRDLGIRDRAWEPRLHLAAGGQDVTTELVAEPETVGESQGVTVTGANKVELRLAPRHRTARTLRAALHYATHFRPARKLRLGLRALRKRWDGLSGHGVKVRVYRRALRRLPVSKGSVVFESHMGRCYGDSPRAVHQEITDRGLRLRCTWSYATSADGFPGSARLVPRWSWRYLWALARAEFWIDNQGFPHALDKPRHTTYLQTWHGSAYKRMGFDEARVKTQNAPHREWLQRAVDRFDHFLVRSEHDVNTLARAYGIPEERLLRCGYPRNDRLLAARARDETSGRFPRPPVAADLGIPDHKTVVLYAPTFRGLPPKNNKAVRLPLDVRKFADRFGDTHVLLVRAHYMQAASLPVCPPGTVVDVSAHHDVSELLCLADVLVTDYSSIMFDFALLDRPLVHFAPDLDAYTAERGSYFSLRDDAGGPVVETEEELLRVLGTLKQTDGAWTEARRAFAARFGAYDQGRAAAGVVDALFGERFGNGNTETRGGA